MSFDGILQTFAEVAVAFAGFASLISLLGRSSEFLDGSRLLGMVRTSLLVTGFALFPFVPLAIGMSEHGAWRLSAILLVAVSGTHTFFTWRQLYRAWAKGLWKVRAGYFTFPAGVTHVALMESSAWSVCRDGLIKQLWSSPSESRNSCRSSNQPGRAAGCSRFMSNSETPNSTKCATFIAIGIR